MNIRAAYRALVGKSFSDKPYIESSLSAYDTLTTGRRPSDITQLANFYTLWPYRCSLINAQGVACTPLRLYRERSGDDGHRTKRIDRKSLDHLRNSKVGVTRKYLESSDKMEEVEDADHPVLRLLNRPNQWTQPIEMMESLLISLQLTGNAFFNIVQPEGSPPSAIHFMPTPWVKIAASVDNYISHYRYGANGATERDFYPTEVSHIRYANPTGEDILWGIGVMQAAGIWHEVSHNIGVFQSGQFLNGGYPSMLAVLKSATAPQLAEFTSKLRQMFKGPRKAGTIQAISGDVQLTKWNMSQEELGFLQASKDKRDDIAAMFGVPTSLLTVENVNLANGRVAAPHWQLLTVRPLAQRLEDALNDGLMGRFRAALKDDSLTLAFDNPVEEEQGVRGERASQLYQSGLITLNEARQEAGWDSVKDGDKFISPPQPAIGPSGFPLAVFNVSEPQTTKRITHEPIVIRSNSPDQGVPDDVPASGDDDAKAGNRPAAEPDGVGNPERSQPADQRLSLYLGTDRDEGCQCGDCRWLSVRAVRPGETETKAVDNEATRELERRLAANEAAMTRAMEQWFNRLVPGIVSSLTRDGGIGIDLGPNSDAAIILRELLSESVTDTFIEGAIAGLRELPNISEDVVADATSRAQRFVQENLVRLSESTLSTVRAGVEFRLQEALEQTATQDFRDVQQAVANAMEQDSTHVSRRIARTESNRMHQEGRLASWRESGSVRRKRWIIRGDSRVSQICRSISAEYGEADLDQPFVPFGTVVAGVAMTYDPRGVMAPPAHPNCRSTIIAVLE